MKNKGKSHREEKTKEIQQLIDPGPEKKKKSLMGKLAKF